MQYLPTMLSGHTIIKCCDIEVYPSPQHNTHSPLRTLLEHRRFAFTLSASGTATMRRLQYITVALLFFFASPLSHASCNDYGAGGIVCTGPNGYSASLHNYGAGGITYQDNQGNTGSIHRYPGGTTVIIPSSSGVPPAADSPMFVPGSDRNGPYPRSLFNR